MAVSNLSLAGLYHRTLLLAPKSPLDNFITRYYGYRVSLMCLIFSNNLYTSQTSQKRTNSGERREEILNAFKRKGYYLREPFTRKSAGNLLPPPPSLSMTRVSQLFTLCNETPQQPRPQLSKIPARHGVLNNNRAHLA